MSAAPFTNLKAAAWLREASNLLVAQGASPYRVAAYRNAADALAQYPRDIATVFEAEGVKGLDAIPKVGLGIAAAIAEMLVTQRWSLLERLRGAAPAPVLLRSVPGIGPSLAARLHDGLHIERLEDLEVAANDGRLEAMPRVGPRRAAAIRASLAEMLGRLRGPAPPRSASLPPVAEILAVDREYRERGARGELRRIAPRRFNPERAAWLPMLHATRGPWHYTALFSNTALAHRLGHVRDWVVVYSYDGDHVERQCTVVTERRGPLAGKRVIRGREPECQHHYDFRTVEDHASHPSHAA